MDDEIRQSFPSESEEFPAPLDRDLIDPIVAPPLTAPTLTAMTERMPHSHAGSSRAGGDRSCDLLGMATCHVAHPNRLLRSNMLSPHQIFGTQGFSRLTRVG